MKYSQFHCPRCGHKMMLPKEHDQVLVCKFGHRWKAEERGTMRLTEQADDQAYESD